jgi:hypothetical protein
MDRRIAEMNTRHAAEVATWRSELDDRRSLLIALRGRRTIVQPDGNVQPGNAQTRRSRSRSPRRWVIECFCIFQDEIFLGGNRPSFLLDILHLSPYLESPFREKKALQIDNFIAAQFHCHGNLIAAHVTVI